MKRRTFANRSFSVVGPKYWNELPNEVWKQPNVESFAELLKHTYSVKRTIKNKLLVKFLT